MKLYNAKLGKVIDATPIMFKSLAIKGWVEIKDEVEPTAINDEVEPENPIVLVNDEVDDSPLTPYGEQQKPKADPVKVKAKSKNKK
jgi:hypothetical protein